MFVNVSDVRLCFFHDKQKNLQSSGESKKKIMFKYNVIQAMILNDAIFVQL